MADQTPEKELQEQGYPPPPPGEVGELPPGGGKWLTGEQDRHVSILNFVSHTYYWTHDEALRDSGTCNTDAMWADPVISTAIRDRQRPVVQLEWQLEARNPSDPTEKQLSQTITEILEDFPNFQQARRCLLDAIWWGRSGVELIYEWDHTAGDKRLKVRRWSPIHGDTLVFKYDGTVGYLVRGNRAREKGVENIEGRSGYAKFLDADEDQCVLVHEFEPMPSDFYRPEMAGSVHGTGYRGRVYWYWWLKQNLMRIMLNFARKAGNGFFLAGFAAGNQGELDNMRKALESQGDSSTIYVPVDQQRNVENVLKHLPVSMTGADFMLEVITYLNGMIRDAILGQSSANKAAPAGLGGSTGDHMGITDDERVKYDAVDLEFPMQKLVNVIARHIAPNVRPPRFQHLADKRQPEEIMAAVTQAMQWGLAIPKTWVQEQLGIPDVQDGDEVLSMIQPMQPAALNSTPSGVPMSGTPGPDPSMAGGGQGGQPQQAGGDPQEAALASQITPMQASRIGHPIRNGDVKSPV